MKNKLKISLIFRDLLYQGKVKNQADFGEKLGYKPSFTSRLLSGKEKQPEDLRNKLSSVFELNDDYLDGLKDTKEPDTEQSPATAIGEISPNRTLLVEQLSQGKKEPELKDQVGDYEEVFSHFKPVIELEYPNAEQPPAQTRATAEWDRTKELEKLSGLPPHLFALYTGRNPFGFNKVYGTTLDVNYAEAKFAAEKLGINVDWLVHGRGEMYVNKSGLKLPDSKELQALDKEFGKILRQWRFVRKFSTGQVADWLGVEHEKYRAWERGTLRPNQEEVKMIDEFYSRVIRFHSIDTGEDEYRIIDKSSTLARTLIISPESVKERQSTHASESDKKQPPAQEREILEKKLRLYQAGIALISQGKLKGPRDFNNALGIIDRTPTGYYLKDSDDIPLEHVEKFCSRFGVGLKWVLQGEGDMFVTQPPTQDTGDSQDTKKSGRKSDNDWRDKYYAILDEKQSSVEGKAEDAIAIAQNIEVDMKLVMKEFKEVYKVLREATARNYVFERFIIDRFAALEGVPFEKIVADLRRELKKPATGRVDSGGTVW